MISLAAAVATAGWAGTTTIPATPDSAHAGGVLPESFLSYAIGFASFPDLAGNDSVTLCIQHGRNLNCKTDPMSTN